MARVPDIVLQILADIPDNYIDAACRKLGISETLEFHLYMDAPLRTNKSCKNFLIGVFSTADTLKLQAIYNKIEFGLLLGGLAPYIGIAVNIIDACFCFALGNYFGCFIAIISCFPIPGFKVVGKGLDKFICSLLRKISPEDIVKISKALNKRLQLFYGSGWLRNPELTEGFISISNELKRLVFKNPFAVEAITANKIIDVLPIKKIQREIPKSDLLLNQVSPLNIVGKKI